MGNFSIRAGSLSYFSLFHQLPMTVRPLPYPLLTWALMELDTWMTRTAFSPELRRLLLLQNPLFLWQKILSPHHKLRSLSKPVQSALRIHSGKACAPRDHGGPDLLAQHRRKASGIPGCTFKEPKHLRVYGAGLHHQWEVKLWGREAKVLLRWKKQVGQHVSANSALNAVWF
jgi:hypothetical protein